MVVGGAGLLKTVIKQRRSRRRASGKRVIFPRMEQNLAVYRESKRPVAVANSTSVYAKNPLSLTISRSEYSLPISDASTYKDGFINVAAGNDLYFPALASHASEYQYFNFSGLVCNYKPIQSSLESGEVAMSVVPTYDALSQIQSWDDLVALSYTKVSSAREPFTFRVTPEMMNKQVKDFKSVVPSSAIDYDDILQNQGFVIYAVRGSPATATKTIGSITVSYTCSLSKPRLNPTASSTNVWMGATSPALVSGADHFCTLVDATEDLTEAQFVISTPYRHKLLVLATASTSGTFVGSVGIDTEVNCSSTVLARTGLSSDRAVSAHVVVPDGNGEMSFNVHFPTCTANWTGFRLCVRAIGRSSLWEDF